MASHLKHLKLSQESQITDSFGHTPCQWNIRTVASCPHSMETKASRKRCVMELPLDAESGGVDYESPPSVKRVRVCADARMPREGVSPHSPNARDLMTKCPGLTNWQYSTDMMRTSVGSVSDLSSIPEETELSRQSSPSSCGSPTRDSSDITTISEQDTRQSFHPSPRSTMSSAFLSPSPATPSVSSDVGVASEPCAVWIAPEIQNMRAHSDSVLPEAILNEM